MKTGKRVFITGATGILGNWVVAEALAGGYRPMVLMRDASEAHARERLEQALRLAGSAAPVEAVEIVRGDVRHRNFGMTRSAFEHLRTRIDLVIHGAASVSFDPKQDENTWLTNVLGVTHVVDLVADTGIPLYHVSTAYVAGNRLDLVREEELDAGQHFKNAYERSKFESEYLLRAAFRDHTIKGAILRPSIIVGAVHEGRIAQFFNFYGFMRLVDCVMSGRVRHNGRFKIALEPHCTKNLIPVDWAARAIWRIIEHEGPSGLNYHLTHPSPVPQGVLIDWANRHLREHGVYMEAGVVEGHGSNSLERLAQLSLRHYGSYLEQEPRFDRTNTDRALEGILPFPEMGMEFFDALYRFARAHDWSHPVLIEERPPAPGHGRAACTGEAWVTAELAGAPV
ncbi:MAG: SDR family oxidoreductase [Candidatus Hydrogenedentes bacterium]|nr:SDR family oxidoreductase [Candidatus Hydrogenedentota bacterium]